MQDQELTDQQKQELVGAVRSRADKWHGYRQPHEKQWFINAAFDRGQQWVEVGGDPTIGARLTTPEAPSYRVRMVVNKLQAKLRARTSKFLKNRPKAVVVPATTEYEDYLNAKATQRAFDFLYRSLRMEARYREAVLWAKHCGKGFWWFHWDEQKLARISVPDPQTGQVTYQDIPLGDIVIESGSPFEMLVPDPGIANLGDQPELIRMKLRRTEELKGRYPEEADKIRPSKSASDRWFNYADQMATLGPVTSPGATASDRDTEYTEVYEWFTRPGADLPQGRYVVIVGDVLVRDEPLPYGFHDMPNPYPVVEFPDMPTANQFWGATLCEQLVMLQRHYNQLMSKLIEHLRLQVHPKLLCAVQHQLPHKVWTSEPGEVINYVAVPQVPPPTAWHPPPISNDLWQALQLLEKQFDDVSQVFPSAEGKVGTATSGFQTNLLQEATDSVHAPDIRAHELAFEEACQKLRRMMKQGYTVPRLLRAIGTNYSPEIFEFSGSQVDEMADLVIEVGSALPTLKAARQEAVMALYDKAILGDPADPEVKRRTLALLEMGSVEEVFDLSKVDEAQARLENTRFQQGIPLPTPKFWENHLVHYAEQTALLKTPQAQQWPPQQQRAMIVHVCLHAKFINPQAAMQIAQQEGLQEVLPMLMQEMGGMAGPQPPAGPPAQGPAAPPVPVAPGPQ